MSSSSDDAPGTRADRTAQTVPMTHAKDANTLASASYLLDDAGNRLREDYFDGSGTEFSYYDYDAAYRLTPLTYARTASS